MALHLLVCVDCNNRMVLVLLQKFRQFFFDNITYLNMYSKPLVVASCPTISPVTLALQLLSGERLIAKFRPEGNRWLIFIVLQFVIWTHWYVVFITVTLWGILQYWEAENKLEPALSSLTSDIPVCIYLRNTISSKESLQTTTLLQLGILNGRTAIRWLIQQY